MSPPAPWSATSRSSPTGSTRPPSVDDMLVTLFPGESHTFRIEGLRREPTVAEVIGPPVLRCANDVG